MQLKQLCLFSLAALAMNFAAAAPLVIARGETKLELDPEKGLVNAIRIQGSPIAVTGTENSPIWRLTLFDEAARKANDLPLRDKGYYWQTPWVQAGKTVTAADAKLVSSKPDHQAGTLELTYAHPQATVTISFTVTDTGVLYQGRFTNQGEDPVTDFAVCPNLRFKLGAEDSVIVPDFSCTGIEYSTVGRLPWSMCDAWDGFLVRESGKFLAFYNIQNPAEAYYPTNTVLTGVGDGGKLVNYVSDTVFFAKKGESRIGVKTRIGLFSDLRHWADLFIADNLPGLKKLRDKHPAEITERMARAFLMPAGGKFDALAARVANVPGTAILHTPSYMRPPAEGKGGWDAFPNYFPPTPEAGTLDEYTALIQSAVGKGHVFMPRNSFFYWAEGTDPDREFGLEKLAMRRVDDKPRVAVWALPGYLVSPSSKIVLEQLEKYFRQWKSMGANAYFTNVIGAIGPYGNRYDFHPEAPAPDRFYHQIFKMMKTFGDRLPMLSEGGGTFQLPYQAGFSAQPAWDPGAPIAAWRVTPDRGKAVGAVPEINNFLMHEYVKIYPHNAGSSDNSDSVPKVSFSLVNGVNLKFGLGSEKLFNAANRRWLRTIALLSQEVWSKIYGARVESYTREHGVTEVEFATARAAANFSEQPVRLTLNRVSAEIAPDGFFFVSNDRKVIAGYFNSLNEVKFAKPELLVIVYGENTARLYTPLADETVEATVAGVDGKLFRVAIPPAPAVDSPEFAGVELRFADGKTTAFGYREKPADSAPEVAGLDAIPPVQPPLPSARTTPLLIDWNAAMPVPPAFDIVNGKVGDDGITLNRNRGVIRFANPALSFDKTVYLETVFRYNRAPAFGNDNGENYLLRPLTGKRTIELRYNLYNDAIRFLIPLANGALADLTCTGVPIRPGKFYHVIAYYNGKTMFLSVNGKTVQTALSGLMQPCSDRWEAGNLTDVTFSLIRVGGADTADDKPIEAVAPSGVPPLTCHWTYSGDKSIPAKLTAPNRVEFTPTVGKHTWCYLFSPVGNHFAGLKEFKALEFTFDLDMPPGMELLVALQLEDGAIFTSTHFPKVTGKAHNQTFLVPFHTLTRAGFSKQGSSEVFRPDQVAYLYVGPVGTAKEPVSGMAELKSWTILR